MTNTETAPLRPAEIFLHLIVTFLAPMFLAATGGDPNYARLAAIETVNAHTARNQTDLLPIAQIIAFGLAILDSINLSMAENLPIPLILRLRGNAASLNRAAEQCRRALRDSPRSDAAPCRSTPDIDPEAERRHEEQVIADLARAEQRLAEIKISARAPETPSAPTPVTTEPAPTAPTVPTAPPIPKAEPPNLEALTATVAASQQYIADLDASLLAAGKRAAKQAGPGQTPACPAPTTPDEDRRNAWAAAMTTVRMDGAFLDRHWMALQLLEKHLRQLSGREYTAEFANLPPAERQEATMRATVLSSVAQELLSGEPMPPSLFDFKAQGQPPHRPHR